MQSWKQDGFWFVNQQKSKIFGNSRESIKWKTPSRLVSSGAAVTGRDLDAFASEVNQCLTWGPFIIDFLVYCNIIYLETDETLYGSEVILVISQNYILPHVCCSNHTETDKNLWVGLPVHRIHQSSPRRKLISTKYFFWNVEKKEKLAASEKTAEIPSVFNQRTISHASSFWTTNTSYFSKGAFFC